MINTISKNFKEKTFADVCCGIGGFRLALEEAGAKCVFSSEIDEFACKVYENNFGEAPSGDITKIDAKDIPDFDILCAGFPCQPFSVAGKREGFKDVTRGTIFFDILRIVESKKPDIVLLENVPNITNHDNGNTFDVIVKSLEALNYTVHHSCLNSSDYDVPQSRKRMYIVALHNDVKFKEFFFPSPIEPTRCVADILEPEVNIPGELYKPYADIEWRASIKSRINKPVQIASVGKNRQGERIYSIKGIAPSLTANGGGRFSKTNGFITEDKPRKLTARECARLMGFPDSFKTDPSYNQATKQFGNSIVVDVLQYIVANIEYDV